MTVKHEDSRYALYPKTGYGGYPRNTDYDQFEGYNHEDHGILVATPHGFVRAESTAWHKPNGYAQSNLYFIHGGVEYCRYFNKCYTQRGLVTKAKQFANDVVRKTIEISDDGEGGL